MNRRAEAVAALEGRLGHVFKDRALLERALTHASVGDRSQRIAHNQVLEYLGDRVLSLLAAEALIALGPEWREGELSQRQVALVSGASCAQAARGLGLGPALRLGGSSSPRAGRENDRVLGDAMEAVVAAVYLDGGLPAARDLFDRAWRDALNSVARGHEPDSKTTLNAWAMARRLPPPAYAVVSRVGSEHAPVFTVEVTVQGCVPTAGAGASVRAAEKAAAALFLSRESAP